MTFGRKKSALWNENNDIFTDHSMFERTFDENSHQNVDLMHGIQFQLVATIWPTHVQKTPAYESLSAVISLRTTFLHFFKFIFVVFRMWINPGNRKFEICEKKSKIIQLVKSNISLMKSFKRILFCSRNYLKNENKLTSIKVQSNCGNLDLSGNLTRFFDE